MPVVPVSLAVFMRFASGCKLFYQNILMLKALCAADSAD